MPLPRDSEERVQAGLAYATHERLAVHYERHMVEQCSYRTPDVVAGIVEPFARSDARWLDNGAGTGLFGKIVARWNKGVSVVAVDIARPMLDLIESPAYVETHLADATLSLPFADATFDGVVMVGLLEHVVDIDALLRNAARVKERSGFLALTYCANAKGRTELCEHDDTLLSHDGGTIRAVLERIGARVVSESEFAAYRTDRCGWIAHRLIVAT
jgi:ubiquinone/menaquinone biosynthesis C-methylase UbiE